MPDADPPPSLIPPPEPALPEMNPEPMTAPLLGAENYEVGPALACGGMGSVLAAQDRKLKRTVAIKVMLQDAHADASMRRRFLREAEVLAMLAHPNIVPIYDLVWEDGLPLFYSMKMVKGRTLQEILDALREEHSESLSAFPLNRLLLIFRKVCDALAFAHSKGVLHRDLKPENVMVGEFGEVLVMDWGLAKKMKSDAEAPDNLLSSFLLHPSSPGATLHGSVMGTPQYMSPEQAMGQVNELDERADIFSLGAILYAILTLRPPVEGRTAQEILENVSSGRITPPCSLRTASRRKSRRLKKCELPGAKPIIPLAHLAGGRVPSALSSVVMQALQPDRAKRYPTVTAMSADIEAYQSGFATSAEKAGAWKQIQLLMLRHKAITASLAALLCISVGFVLKVMASDQRARHALGRAQISLAEAAFRRSDLAGMVSALEGTPADLRGQEWEYYSAKRDSSSGPLKVEGFTQPVAINAVPGRPGQFAIGSRDGKIGFVDVASGKLLRTIDTGYPGNLRFCFSGDGRRMLSLTHGAPKARLFDLTSGAEVTSFAVEGDNAGRVDPRFSFIALDWTGDLAAVVNVQRHDLQLIETATAKVRWKRPGNPGKLQFHPNGQRLIVIKQAAREFDLINVRDGSPIVSLPNYPQSMALSPDARVVALGLHTGELVLVDSMTGHELRRAQLHTNVICSVGWTGGGNLLTVGGDGRFGSEAKSLRLWNPARFAPHGTFFGIDSTDPFMEAQLDAASGYLITKQSPPQLWRIPDVPLAREEQRNEQGWSCNFLSDEVLLARKDFELMRYDVSDPRRPARVTPAYQRWHALSAVHAGSGLFALGKPFPSGPADPPGSVRLLHFASGVITEKWNRPEQPEESVICMDFDARAQHLLLVHRLTGLQILDVATGGTLATLPYSVDRAAFAGRHGSIVALERRRDQASKSQDRILLIDPAEGQIRASLSSPHRLNALAVSPDRSLVAIAGDDQTVVILDGDTLAEKHRFRAHDAAITALRFHPGKPLLATGSIDYSIKLWDYATAEVKQTILGLDGRPVMLAFSPNGRLLAVDGMESSFRIFDLSAAAQSPVPAARSAASLR